MEILVLLWYLIISALVIFGLIIWLIKLTSTVYPNIQEHACEREYYDPRSHTNEQFPSWTELASCDLTVVVPAYNESTRLSKMLDEAISHLQKRAEKSLFTYEIIIVDDGSKDNTTRLALAYSKEYGADLIRVLTLYRNRGKGGAIRLGMMRARGKLLLFADADGATKFSDFDKLETSIKTLNPGTDLSDSLSIICGSRAHLEESSIAERSYLRTLLMYGFHFLVRLFAVKGIKDTQCGFKLMTRRTARILFQNLHIERWAFDVELLYIAQSLHIPIGEVAVNWTEIEGSKVTPIISWIEMGFDLFMIWLRYTIKAWQIKVQE